MKTLKILACAIIAFSAASTASAGVKVIERPIRVIELSDAQRAALQFALISARARSKAGEMVPVCELAFESCWGHVATAATPAAQRAVVRDAKQALTRERNRIKQEFLRVVFDGKRTLRSIPLGAEYLDDLTTLKAEGLAKIDTYYRNCMSSMDGLLAD